MDSSAATEPRIFLLGRFAVEVGGKLIPSSAWKKRRPVEVLATLALAPGRMLHREELIDRVWPDKDLEAGANNLHRALHDLRKITDADLTTFDRGVARLREDVWIDVDAFEQACASSTKESLARGVDLYQGALLPDDPYSDALAARREGLRQRFIDAGLRLATLHHEAKDGTACIAILRRMLALDPALEPAHQLLMRALAESGRKGDALRQFAECTTSLRERLDIAPSKATLELRVAIEQDQIATQKLSVESGTLASGKQPSEPPPVAARAPLVLGDPSRPMHGRASEIETARRFVAEGSGVLLIVGEAGLGKTRLAAECVKSAIEAGAIALVGLGLDQDSGVPYAPFADAWARHRRTTAVVSADTDPFMSFAPSGGSAQEDRLRLFQSVERSVQALGEYGPVLLVIEDLHQADPSSLHLFHHLARATRTMRLMLVGTLREEEVHVGRALHTLLGSVGRERLATRIVLGRIDIDGTARIVAEQLGMQDPAVVAAVHALAEGNPFHTEEVVQAMREEGTTRPTLPTSLQDTVRHRVRRLGRDAERLFSAAAIVGLRFPFEIARRAAGLETEPALDALEQGVDARIIEENANEYRFRHALTRQALLDGLTHARRVYLHRMIAEALEAENDALPEVLAFHHEGAGQLDRALPRLIAAGERAQQRLGFTEAIAFFERAIALMDALGRAPDEERFSVLRNMGGMRIALSDLDGAVRDLDAAALLATTATRRALVRRVAALALIQGGNLGEAGKRLEDAVAALGGSKDDPELPAVLYLFAQLRWHEEKFADARELAQRSLAEAEARGDRRAMAKGHEMVALACHSLGAWQKGHFHEQERQKLTDGALDVDQAFDVHLCLWEYHLYGDHGSAGFRSAVDQMLEQARRMHAPRAIALCETFAGTLDFQSGLFDEAEKRLRLAIDAFRQLGSASGEALALQRLGVLLTARGALEESRAILDEGIVVGVRAAMRSHCLTRIHASLTRNRLAADDRDGAQRCLEDGLAEAARHGHCSTCNALLLPEAVRVELAWDNVRAAEAYATKLEDVATRFESRVWTAMAKLARGRVLGARGKVKDAEAAFDDARRAYEEIGSPYEAARCLLAASKLYAAGSRKDPARATELLNAARNALAAINASDCEG